MTIAKHSGARDLFAKNMLSLLAQMRAGAAGSLAGRDIEFLHQLRVAVRRARAILSLYSDLLDSASHRTAVRELRWLGHVLGPARDSDVFLDEIWPPIRDALGASPLTATLERQWRRERCRNGRIAQRALAGRRCRKFLSWLEQWASQEPQAAPLVVARDLPAREFGQRELQSRLKRLRKHGKSLEGLDAPALHALRVDIKKLRYMVEALSPVFRKARVKALLAVLSRLQHVLGEMNDIEVASWKLKAAFSKRRLADTIRYRRRFEDWRTMRGKGLKRKLRKAWQALDRAESLW